MTDYRLDGLSTRTFEHLVQALALDAISTTVTPFGDGPDGGREVTFNGQTGYGSSSDPWNGYGVIQAKFLQRPKSSRSDGQWIVRELTKELTRYQRGRQRTRNLDCYILATNVTLTPTAETGSKDAVLECLEKFATRHQLRGYDIWDYDKLRILIDSNSSVRRAYAAWITPGDVLMELSAWLEKLRSDHPAVNLSADPGLEALIGSVDVEELGGRHAQSAGSEVTTPDATPQPSPADHAESDPVAVAAARVAEKWQEMDQLDTRRVETGADVESEMQRVLADGLNMAMEIVGKISNRVISEVEAGGLRGRTGYRALPHVREAVAALEAVGVSSSNGKQWQETMDKTSAVFDPLHLAYNCLTSPEGEVATPDATPQPSPADHAESDPVAVAAARVAERWQEMDQLDTRRVETGADVESEMQHAVQGAVNITKEVLVIICDRVISEVKAGGQRERIGRRALPHANGAMAAMEVITSNSKGRNRYEWMDEVSAVFDPLHLAYNCLVSAESEMATPDATLWPLPAKHAESDPVALAAARVAEKRQELNQLDSRRIETGADVESEMQRAVQDALDITTEIFGNMGDRVVSEVKAGGLRGRIGNRALPHVRDAMAAMEAVVACNRRKCDIHECMDKILAVFGPLALAYNCLAASS